MVTRIHGMDEPGVRFPVGPKRNKTAQIHRAVLYLTFIIKYANV